MRQQLAAGNPTTANGARFSGSVAEIRPQTDRVAATGCQAAQDNSFWHLDTWALKHPLRFDPHRPRRRFHARRTQPGEIRRLPAALTGATRTPRRDGRDLHAQHFASRVANRLDGLTFRSRMSYERER